MRILTVGNGYPPHHHGGYELVWSWSVDHLRASGDDVEVLTLEEPGASHRPEDGIHRELRWHLRDGRFDKPGLLTRAAVARHNHAALDKHLDRFQPDVIGWWSMGGLSLTMLETARRRGVPAVAFVHDEWLDYGRWADRWLGTFTGPRRRRLAPPAAALAGVPTSVDFDGAAKYIFVSEFTRDQALGTGIGITRTGVAHSGIDERFLDPQPPREWTGNLLYVGRIDRRKGIDTAVAALSHLPPDCSLTIVGSWDTGEEQRLRVLGEELGVGDRVIFAGQLEGAVLRDAYADADAVVFPVRWNEPWGLVPIEAMARGRPVVATGRGGSAEYLRDGENCLLFPADDERALADAVNQIAASPELRETLREGGLRTAPQHTASRFNAEVERALREAVS